jgi:hypothetical protein
MNNIKTISEGYAIGSFTGEVQSAFDEIIQEKNSEWIQIANHILSDKKSEEFTEETLRTINYFRNSFTSENQKEETLRLVGEIAVDVSSSSEIRSQAITQLGNLGIWPDSSLRQILEKENDLELKVFAFKAILTQLKLPESVISSEFRRALYAEIEPSFHEINRITQARANGEYDSLDS